MNNKISVAPLYGETLSHSGIKGQKWGIMHGPPYPLARGKAGRLPKIKKIVKSRQSKEEKQATKRALKAEEKKEALKKNIIEHPSKLYKYKDMFSKEELEDILKAIDFDQKLKDVRRGQLKKTIDTAKDIAIGVTAVKNIAMSAVDLYKSGRDITSILKDHGTFSEVQERKKAAEETAKKASSPTPESKKSEPKKDNSAPSSTSEPKNVSNKMDDDYFTKGNRNDFKVSSSNRSDASSGITSDDSKSKKKDQKYARREAAGFSFLDRLGLADPSTYR